MLLISLKGGEKEKDTVVFGRPKERKKIAVSVWRPKEKEKWCKHKQRNPLVTQPQYKPYQYNHNQKKPKQYIP